MSKTINLSEVLTPNIESFNRYFSLSPWQFVILLGLAISGFVAFVNTYNYLASIDKSLQNCANTNSQFQQQIHAQFIWLLVISIIAIVVGFLLAWLLHKKTHTYKLVVLTIILIGSFLLAYAINLKLEASVNLGWKLGLPWTAFLFFILLGIIFNFTLGSSHSKTA